MNIPAHPVVTTAVMLAASNLFMTFAVLYMGEEVKMNYLYAAVCLMGAVYFIFRG